MINENIMNAAKLTRAMDTLKNDHDSHNHVLIPKYHKKNLVGLVYLSK